MADGSLIPFGAFQPDLSDLNGGFTSSAQNVYPRGDGFGPVGQLAAFSAALGAVCRGYFYARNTDSTVAIFAATATRLYKLDNTSFTWSDVSKGGAAYTSVATTAQWQFQQFNKYVIAVQANVPPQVFDLTSSSAFADLGGSPPNAAYIAIVNRFVVLSGLASNPLRVQWSGLNAPTTWTSGTNSSDFQDMSDGGPVRTIGALGGEIGIITQDDAVRRMVYQPGSDVIFTIERAQGGRGIAEPYSLAVVGERVFYRSTQGFVMADSSGAPIPIGKEKVDRWWASLADSTARHLVIASGDPKGSYVVWSCKTTSGSANQFDMLLRYDFLLEQWAPPVYQAGEFVSVMAAPGITLEGLDAVSTSIETMLTSFDNYALGGLSTLSVVNTAHQGAFFSTTPLEAIMDTPEQSQISTRLRLTNGFKPITDAATVYGSVGYRNSLDETATWTAESARNRIGTCPLRADAFYMRGRLRIPAGTAWTFARGLVPQTMSGSGRA